MDNGGGCKDDGGGRSWARSRFLVDYSPTKADEYARASGTAAINAFKVCDERGKLRAHSDWPQGFSGHGAERFASGETYVGEYSDAMRHGRGTFVDKSGAVLASLWRENLPMGEGAKALKDGTLVRTLSGRESKAAGGGRTALTEEQAESITRQLGMRPLDRSASLETVGKKVASTAAVKSTPLPRSKSFTLNRAGQPPRRYDARDALTHDTPQRAFERGVDQYAWREPPAWQIWPQAWSPPHKTGPHEKKTGPADPSPRKTFAAPHYDRYTRVAQVPGLLAPSPARPRRGLQESATAGGASKGDWRESLNAYRQGVSQSLQLTPRARRDDFLQKLRVAEKQQASIAASRTPRSARDLASHMAIAARA